MKKKKEFTTQTFFLYIQNYSKFLFIIKYLNSFYIFGSNNIL